MKARLIFERKDALTLKFGGRLTLYMDCYQVADFETGFEKAFTFSWIVYDPLEPSRRLLMDQHNGRPCHIHIGQKDLVRDVELDSIEEAIDVFWAEVKNYFGELLEAP